MVLKKEGGKRRYRKERIEVSGRPAPKATASLLKEPVTAVTACPCPKPD